MKIVVTGGLGYIGSHTVVELQLLGYEVLIIDNCSNSSTDVLKGIAGITGSVPYFENFDLRDKSKVQDFFKRHTDIVGLIHFAASKAVGESVENPLLYYENNLTTLIYVLQELKKLKKIALIYSSSCSVYGQADELPITENTPIKPAVSPYGNTKQIGEEIIRDTCKMNTSINAIALRYFNPTGAHPSAEIGEKPSGIPANLIPYITQTAIGIREELSIFGDDYPTKDGTAIRDYIHIVDLAKAHVIALERLLNNKNEKNYEVFNIGSGKGTSVFEVIKTFEKITKTPLNYKIAPKREGDITAAYADTTKANKELGWITKSSLEEALESAWKWEQKIRKV